MKKAINLLFTYLLFLLAGLIIGTFLYSFYINLQDFVAGREISFFSDGELYKSVFHIAYCMVFLICPLIAYYRIRHPGGIPQTIAYIILCLITWFALFPGIYKLNQFCDKYFLKESQKTYLSEGYFRQIGNKVYYFTNEFSPDENGDVSASAVVIDISDLGKVYFDTIVDDGNLELLNAASPYKEILVKETFSESLMSLPLDMNLLVAKQKEAFDTGFLSYLGFLTIALVICAMYGLTTFFEWKLINVSILTFGELFILVVNSIYYMPVLIDFKLRLISNVLIQKLGHVINDPLIFVINLLFTFIFVVIGVIKFVLHVHGKKEK